MALNAYQAKYYAYELQRSYANDHVGKLAGLLFDAQVEPKPHQIDAALFALQTPYLNGVILADEVGLGKTIEAGIVITQYWAERKRRPTENAKIKAATKHFAAIGVGDYAVSTPANWRV